MCKDLCRLHLLANMQDAGEVSVQTLQQQNMQAFAMSQCLYFRRAFAPAHLSATYGCCSQSAHRYFLRLLPQVLTVIS